MVSGLKYHPPPSTQFLKATINNEIFAHVKEDV
jgi:hypothetical protein